MLGLTIAAIVTVAAGYLIVKRAYAPAVLLVAGVVLLAIAAFGDIGLGLGLKKSSGSIFFDIFLVVENVMSTTRSLHHVHGGLREIHGPRSCGPRSL